jgi:hypothetical protein
MCVQILIQVPAFNAFGNVFRSGSAGSYSNFMFRFLRNCRAVFHSCYSHFTFSPVVHRCSNFPHSGQYLLYFFSCSSSSKNISYSNVYKVLAHCGFDIHFTNNLRCSAFFMWLLAMFILWRNLLF